MGDREPGEVTRLLLAVGAGDQRATDALLPIVYEELRELARRRMAREPAGHTLQPTALVHEAYLRLLGGDADDVTWANRRHFFGAAAEAMRRILIERARRYKAQKHGGGRRRLPLDDRDAVADVEAGPLLALDAALERLRRHDARMAEIVMLRYFAGLGVEATAEALGISPRTVKREWAVARAWLHRAVSDDEAAIDDG